jgi:1-acyl-sn-glycerol-3-phosphate acyltransferase
LNKDTGGRLPNKFLYALAEAFIYPYLAILYRPRYVRDPKVRDLKPPFLVLGNHPSTWDPFHLSRVMHPFRINFLTSNLFFRHPLVGFLLRGVGAIPKIQFRSDPKALKTMLQVIGLKGIIGIFPEGTRSADGSTTPVRDALSKLVKKAGMPVVTVIGKGSYLSRPRWSSSGNRRGHVTIESHVLLTAEQVKGMTVDAIRAVLETAIHHNEYDWQRTARVPFLSKAPAESLDTILHKCPACHGDWVLRTKGRRLFCSACGNAAVMDDFGLLSPETPESVVFEDAAAWNAWQRQEMSAVVARSGFRLESRVKLRSSDLEQPFRDAGEGTIVLDCESLRYSGTDGERHIEQVFPLPGILGISADYGENFEIVMDKTTYRFFLEQGQQVISYAHAVDILRESIVRKSGKTDPEAM